MIDIDEKQAKEILNYLVKRSSKRLDIAYHIDSNGKYINYDGYFLNITDYGGNIIIQYYYYDYWPVNILIRPVDNTGKRINFNIDNKHISIKEILDILFNASSEGYAIESYDRQRVVTFMSSHETLEQILIEKDLEENMIA